MDYVTSKMELKKIYADYQAGTYQPTPREFWRLYLHKFITLDQYCTYDPEVRPLYEKYLAKEGMTIEFSNDLTAADFMQKRDRQLREIIQERMSD